VTTLLLLRHGETTWNRQNRMQGWAPVGLTDRGREQARRAGERIAAEYDPERLVSSDLLRARETTAELLSAAGPELALEPSFEPAWRERGLGDLQGLTVEALFGGFPEYSVRESGAAALEARPPNGESVLDVRERVLGAWEGLLETGTDTVVVTHGGPMAAVLGRLRGQDALAGTLTRDNWAGNGSLAEVVVEDGEPRLVRTLEQEAESR
jgi:probable phosphoglycerate mutase